MAWVDTEAEFTRPQLLTLVAGVLQLALGLLDVFPLSPEYHVLQLGVGALGVVMSIRHDLARMYGLALLLFFGWMSLGLNEVNAEGFLEVRTAVVGAVITLVRPGRSAE
ncbi:hypothetical protein FKR81_10270 [Lentzea tibetensis]|uniref:Uncharacterized protein n=1 Tax=Lentzea tibetensis TaxID=2591470 RepID=A0A563EY84_9PSEU|nr:hypothetical protein [Lentzea tibetensis]TWP52675.1 hypothetical protein FKR81_10270 [Lentzea tibetensis]